MKQNFLKMLNSLNNNINYRRKRIPHNQSINNIVKRVKIQRSNKKINQI